MAYRSDLDAMEARVASLDAELAERSAERDEALRMLEEARARERNDRIYADYAAGGPARRFRRNCWIGGGILIAAILGMFAFRIMTRDHSMERMIDKFEGFTQEMCACPDSACSSAVTDRMTKWSVEASRDFEKSSRPTQAEMKRMTALGERLASCMTKTIEMTTPPAP